MGETFALGTGMGMLPVCRAADGAVLRTTGFDALAGDRCGRGEGEYFSGESNKFLQKWQKSAIFEN